MTPLQERFKEAIDDNDCLVDYIANDHCILPEQYKELSIACEKIADEFAEKFATWMDDNGCTKFNGGWVSILDTEKSYTLNELLQHFKDERK